MKRSHTTVLATVSLFAYATFGQSKLENSGAKAGNAPVVSEAGVVVENVDMHSAGERAGFAEGDVLLGWTRGNEKGQIHSPFDISEIEIEQAPRGEVTLEGTHGTAKRSWALGQDAWGIKTRPNLAGTALATYLEGVKLAAAGKLTEAAARWRSAGIQIEETHPSPPELGRWFRSHAADLLAQAGNWKQADLLYQEAVIGKTEASPLVIAQLQRAWGFTYWQRNDWNNARRLYQDALDQISRTDSESLLLADTLSRLGAIAIKKGDPQFADSYLLRALAIREKLAPNSLATAYSLNILGYLAMNRADFGSAEDYLLKALTLRTGLAPESLEVAMTLNNLGGVAWGQGQQSRADEYHHRALAIREKLAPGSLEVAASYNNLGLVAQERGDFAQAEEYYRRDLAIAERLAPGTLDLSTALSNLGWLALQRDDLERSEQWLSRGLAIRRKLAPDSLDVATSMADLGDVSLKRGEMAKAEGRFREALKIREKLAPNSLLVAASYTDLGTVAGERGDLAASEKYHLQALAIANALEPYSLDVARTLSSLAELARKRGRTAEAEAYFRQCLAIREKLAPGSSESAEALAGLAALTAEENHLDASAELFKRSLSAIENQMNHFGGTSNVRSDFRAKYADYYKGYEDVLLRQNQPELAFQVLERSRARTLLETLVEAHVDIRNGADARLLERERALRSALGIETDRRIRLLGAKHTEEEVNAANKKIEELTAQYDDVEAPIRAASAGYAALTQPQLPTAKEVQEQLLDQDTLLLEFSLGERRSHVFAVSANTLAAYELPKRAEIENAARRVYRLLSARNHAVPGETESQRQARLAKSDAQFVGAVQELSAKILGPVAEQIRGNKKRLLIVSDGALQYIPFAALPAPQEATHLKKPIPLVRDHEIVNLPSASVLSVLRMQQLGRSEPPKALAVLADPVFDKGDYRVKAGGGPAVASAEKNGREDLPAETLARSLADLNLDTNGQFRLHRLPFTRQEAQAILAVTPDGQGMEALDFRANRAMAMSQELAQYRIVHFATHALLDSAHPELSGLVLSLVDQQGRPQSGFLGLQDIYNLNLPADLVVLSACETALGKEIKSEGLVGLTRGFMYAGADRVVASLWNVSDIATSKFMTRFYTAMERGGMSPAAALRVAQIHMWKQKRWSSPYYWAAFQIQGEWK
jgi:CHAT domain-containing protein/Tfp pilus assembly protein PilF